MTHMFLYMLKKVKDMNKCCVLVCSENAFVPNWVASYHKLDQPLMQPIYSVPKWNFQSQYQCAHIITIYILQPRQAN